ncbi:MAG: hypothetical protein R3337_00065 [Gammaproteobacteria bacterium]|nr:hypothetical protein [Gammaproteobacteria bacterium]
MPSNVPFEEDIWPENFTIPNDGEDADQASLLNAFEEYANALRWLKKRLFLFGTIGTTRATVPLSGFQDINGGFAPWVFGNQVYLRQRQLGGQCIVHLPALYSSMLLREVRVWAAGGGHLTTALPATMPSVRLYRQDAVGAVTQLAAETFSAASMSAYQSGVNVTLEPSGDESVVENRGYFLRIFGESGENAIADDGFKVFAISMRVQGN